MLTVLLIATACNQEAPTSLPAIQQRAEVVLHPSIDMPTGSTPFSRLHVSVPVTLLNRTPHSLSILGDDLTSPVYTIQFRETPTSAWQTYDITWCATGLAPRDLPAGHLSHFTVPFPLEYLNREVRLLIPVFDANKREKAYDIESNIIFLR